jgi:antitoxin component of MazEF toxin-antitoxin module
MRFKAKIQKWGTSHVIVIPSDYIKNEQATPGSTYWFDIQEEITE